MADTERDRRAPPTPSSYILADDPHEVARRESDPARPRESNPEEINAHLNLDRIEGRMNQSVARQVVKILRENPDVAAGIVRGWTKKRD